MENETNTMRDFQGGSDFGIEKANKEQELNASMSIAPQAPDEYENKMIAGGGN